MNTTAMRRPDASATPVIDRARRGRERGFLGGAREVDDEAVQVVGRLPDWLQGSLLLNGPALWELRDDQLRHWFDGFAMMHRLRIEAGRVRYRSRFVQSQAYRHSTERGRSVHGEFGSPHPGSLWARLWGTRGSDNPAVVMSRHGPRWLATTETPYLTYFDPETLVTQERLDLHDALGVHLMAAHGFTLDDGSYLNLATRLGRTCEQLLFRLAPGSSRPETLARLPMAEAGYTHAFALAAGHAVVWECALRARPLAFRFGAGAYKDNFSWKPATGSRLHAVALQGGAVRSWSIAPMMAFHATQAWSEGEDLLLELATYDNADVFNDLLLDRRRRGDPLAARPTLVRYRMRAGHTNASVEPLGVALELQQVHPGCVGKRRAAVCWGGSGFADGEFFDRTLRLDLLSGVVTSWQRQGAMQLEPLFVPRPGGVDDDDGVLLVPTLADGDDRTVLAVVDARTMQALAELHAPQVLPFGFHAAFAQAPVTG